MDPLKRMREDVKSYIETADEKVIRMIHTMLEADAGEGLRQSDRDEVMSYDEVIIKPKTAAKIG